MLGNILGRALGEATGLNRAARSAGARHAARRLIDAEVEHLTDDLREAPDSATARRRAAATWLRLHRWRGRLLEQLTVDTRGAQAMCAAVMTVFEEPAFDDLPLVALGLGQVAAEPSPIWVGRPEQLVDASAALVLRGWTTLVSPDREHVDVFVGDRQVARLLADPEHAIPDSDRVVPRPRRPRRWVRAGWLFAAGALVAVFLAAFVVATCLRGAAVVAWVGHAVRRGHRARPGQWQIARLVPTAPAASASPYRDAQPVDHVSSTALLGALERASKTAHPRGRDLVLDGDDVVLVGAALPEVPIATLTARHRDLYKLMRHVHPLVDLLGPIAVVLPGRTIDVRAADAYPGWEAEQRADDRRRRALLDALAAGHRAALAVD